MKKLFTLFFCLVSLTVTFTGCSEEAIDVKSVNKQTILVMFPWTGSYSSSGLYDYLQHNLDSMEYAIKKNKGLNNTRVLVFFSRSARQSELFELTYNTSTYAVDHTPVATYEGHDYTSTEGLASVIRTMKERTEALNYAMIIGGHGLGWIRAEDWQAASNSSEAKAKAKAAELQTPKYRHFGSTSTSTNDFSIDITTLADAIKANGIKMQYILFDACFMANAETAYQLREATNFLVASPYTVINEGMPYAKVWNYLNTATPNYTSLVSTYLSYYNSTSTPYASLAAIDCRQMDNLAAVMKEINQKYTITDEQLAGVQYFNAMTPTLFYDLGNYVDSLHVNMTLKSKFDTQMAATVKTVQYTGQTMDDDNNSHTVFITVSTNSGLTISDPSKHAAALRGKETTAWWKATH